MRGAIPQHAPLAVGYRLRGHQHPGQCARHHLYGQGRLGDVLCRGGDSVPVHRLRAKLRPRRRRRHGQAGA